MLLTGALAGCIGGDGEAAGPDQADAPEDEGNATAPANASGEAPASTTWQVQNETGTVTGVSVPVTGTAINEPTTSENTFIEFTVGEEAQTVRLNLTVDGGELTMGIDDADCDTGPETSGCDFVTTEDGQATYEATDPPAGDWSVSIFAGEPAVVQADFELTIAQQVPA
jgi:hypothetical protein